MNLKSLVFRRTLNSNYFSWRYLMAKTGSHFQSWIPEEFSPPPSLFRKSYCPTVILSPTWEFIGTTRTRLSSLWKVNFGCAMVRAHNTRHQSAQKWYEHQTAEQSTTFRCIRYQRFFLNWFLAILTNSCTIPGCNYPHILHQPAGMKRKINVRKLKKRRKTLLLCQLGHNQATSNRYMVECSMHCRQGWKPAGDVNSTRCDSEQVAFLRSSGIVKPTNFTTDYLECEPIS